MRYKYWVVGATAIFVVIGWTVYWSAMRDRAVMLPEEIAADLRAAGFEARVGAASGGGFPSRLSVTANAPEVISSDGSWAWRADSLNGAALIYRPDHLVLDWAEKQTIETPFGLLSLTSPNMRTSLVFDGDTSDTLLRLSLDAPTASVVSPGGGAFAARAQLHLRAAPVNGVADHINAPYELASSIEDLSLRPTASTEATPVFETITLRGEAVLNAAPSRFPLRLPMIKQIAIDEGAATWAGTGLTFSGAADWEQNQWVGSLEVAISRAPYFFERLVTLGVIDAETAQKLTDQSNLDGDFSGLLSIDGDGVRFGGVAIEPSEDGEP